MKICYFVFTRAHKHTLKQKQNKKLAHPEFYMVDGAELFW